MKVMVVVVVVVMMMMISLIGPQIMCQTHEYDINCVIAFYNP